jgi:hypothetical protein
VPSGGAEPPAVRIVDDDGHGLELTATQARTLLALTRDLEPATVSACPACRSRVLAAVALVDLLTEAPPYERGLELVDLADDAPTLHLYLLDLAKDCRHRAWRDPGYLEWCDVIEELSWPGRVAP